MDRKFVHGSHDLRRGAAHTIAKSGGNLAEILTCGQWSGRAFRTYLEMNELDTVAMTQCLLGSEIVDGTDSEADEVQGLSTLAITHSLCDKFEILVEAFDNVPMIVKLLPLRLNPSKSGEARQTQASAGDRRIGTHHTKDATCEIHFQSCKASMGEIDSPPYRKSANLLVRQACVRHANGDGHAEQSTARCRATIPQHHDRRSQVRKPTRAFEVGLQIPAALNSSDW